MPLKKEKQSYTYADYLTWDDDERWEIIDGVPYMISPAPAPKHQELSISLASQFYTFLEDKPCKVYAAPFDVRLDPFGKDDTVVQPDITIICDRSKIDERGLKGSPDLALEILSPSTAKHDRLLKFQRYLRAKVKEYWIVDPETGTVQVNILNGDNYTAHMYNDDDEAVPVNVLEGCTINLKRAFKE